MTTTTVVTAPPNRLINAQSPYLLQHAHDPVYWYPWGAEAFERAQKENKPVFLSIGYSACHWCHVMHEESFKDAKTAELLNAAFICIKVDREERPDIDRVYMAVCQLMTGLGGWPLSIIMTPGKIPFFADTYIPRESRLGRPGFLELIPRVVQMWNDQRDDILASGDQIVAKLKQPVLTSLKEQLNITLLESAYARLEETFDPVHKGFDDAPKFPSAAHISFLLRYGKRSGRPNAFSMAGETLQAMRAGGIYDQVGFGFHRYSTDRAWRVPHFEKMLYDQALLVIAYVDAYQATQNPEYRRTAEEIIAYVLRDMASPEGGFYSSEDADSEGREGKFYLWTEAEIRGVLDESDAAIAARVFNIRKEGNFNDPITGDFTGDNILYRTKPVPELAQELGMAADELAGRLEKIRRQLFTVRSGRVRPRKDDKILTDWNGLMIAALSRASRAFGTEEYAVAARAAADFISAGIDERTRQLPHRYHGGAWGIPGFLDDYVFFVNGLYELYESTFELKYMTLAVELTRYLLKHFWDAEHGGFFFSPDTGERVLVRDKVFQDNGYPSGNSLALLDLLRLSRITGDKEYEDRAEAIASAASGMMLQYPSSFTQMLQALDFMIGPSLEIVIAGRKEAPDTRELVTAVRQEFLPNKVVLFRPQDIELAGITTIATFTEPMTPVSGKATAYVCRNYRCEAPVTSTVELAKILSGAT